MKLIVGLGNVGKQYENTRHNVGFMVVDELAKRLDAQWRLEKKLKSAIAEAEINGDKVILAKPQTMMNLSGEAVQALISSRDQLEPENTWVVYDDIDIEMPEVRVRDIGSSGGHNGLKSVISNIGESFNRIRVGIDPNQRPAEPSEIYVLKPFSSEQKNKLAQSIERAIEVLLNSL